MTPQIQPQPQPQDQKKAPFRPWLGNLIWSGYGLIALWMAWHFLYESGQTMPFAYTAAVVGVFTVWNWKQFMARTYGQSVEKKAVKALRKYFGDKLQTGVLLPGNGDIDAVLALQNQKFNIEIKSIQDVNKVTRKHAEQALAASNYLGSTPVIWLPAAQIRQIKDKDGVRVFAGTAKDFAKYLEKM